MWQQLASSTLPLRRDVPSSSKQQANNRNSRMHTTPMGLISHMRQAENLHYRDVSTNGIALPCQLASSSGSSALMFTLPLSSYGGGRASRRRVRICCAADANSNGHLNNGNVNGMSANGNGSTPERSPEVKKSDMLKLRVLFSRVKRKLRPKKTRTMVDLPGEQQQNGVVDTPPPLLSSVDVDVGREARRALPDIPKSASLVNVMPFLWHLALADTRLRFRLAVALSLVVVCKGLGLLVPVMFKQAVDALDLANGGLGPQSAVKLLLLMGAYKAISQVANELRAVVFTPVAQEAGRKVALSIFAHLMDLDISYHMGRRTGALVRIIDRGTRSVTMVFRAVVFTFLPTLVELVLVCGLLSWAFNPILVVCVLSTFAIYVMWTAYFTSRAAALRKEVNRLDNLATGATVDTLMNVETIQHFDNAKLRSFMYNDLLCDYQLAAVKTEQTACLLNAGQGVTMSLGIALTLSAAFLSGQTVKPGDLVLINGLLLQLWAPLSFLGFFYRELRQSLVDMENMFDVMQIKTQVPDGSIPLPLRSLKDEAEEGVGVEVNFKDVKFGYNENREVLKGINLRIRSGENIAIVGPSGSGKSTLLKLLLRMYDPTAGSIFIEDIDLTQVKLSSLRDCCAVVPQDTALFNDSLLNNIAFGRPGATEAEIVEASKAAQLHDTVSHRFPDGYSTVVGERGLKLSGGEKQRVAIARAFIRRPRLVICDEATSALDSGTEQGIQASLQGLSRGRTCITIAHRLSTVKDCDRIIVLEDGHIIEEGSHSDLLKRDGIYTNMWSLQLAEEEVAKEQGNHFEEDLDVEDSSVFR